MINTLTWEDIVKKYINYHVFRLITIIVSIIITSVITSAVYAEIIKRLVSSVIEVNTKKLNEILFCLVCVMTISAILKIIIGELKFYFQKGLKISLEDECFNCIFNVKNINKIKSDETMAIMQNSIGTIVDKITNTTQDFLSNIVCIIAAVIYAVNISWQVIIFCFFVCGIMMILTLNNNKQIPLKAKKVSESFNDIYSIMWDHLHNSEITPFLNSSRVFAGYDRTVIRNSDLKVQASRCQNIARIFSSFGTVIIVIMVALYGALMAIHYKMDIANILALLVVVPVLSDSLFQLPNIILDFKSAHGEGEVLNKLYKFKEADLEDEVDEVLTLKRPNNLTAKSLKYRYSVNTPYLFDIEYLTLQKGEILCITGKSGIGKSTLLNIFSSVVKDYEGNLFWDDFEMKNNNSQSAWIYIDFLEQKPCCLPTTIKNNITLTDKECNEEFLERAVLDSGVYEYINKSSLNMETPINVKKVSSGEMQKICLARAFYRNKPILILDEATSAMDPSSEKYILKRLKDRAKEFGLIVIAVTHSVNFLKQSDKVLFLQNDSPAIIDRHDILIEKSHRYKELIYAER